jgi:hypothetical protein
MDISVISDKVIKLNVDGIATAFLTADRAAV